MWPTLNNAKADTGLIAGFITLFVVALALGRTEAFVGSEAFRW